MSTRSKQRAAHRHQPALTKSAGGSTSRLALVEQAQIRLDKNAELFRAAQEERRKEVRRAFAAGVSVRELSAALKVSQAKVYDLLGGVKRSKTA